MGLHLLHSTRQTRGPDVSFIVLPGPGCGMERSTLAVWVKSVTLPRAIQKSAPLRCGFARVVLLMVFRGGRGSQAEIWQGSKCQTNLGWAPHAGPCGWFLRAEPGWHFDFPRRARRGAGLTTGNLERIKMPDKLGVGSPPPPLRLVLACGAGLAFWFSAESGEGAGLTTGNLARIKMPDKLGVGSPPPAVAVGSCVRSGAGILIFRGDRGGGRGSQPEIWKGSKCQTNLGWAPRPRPCGWFLRAEPGWHFDFARRGAGLTTRNLARIKMPDKLGVVPAPRSQDQHCDGGQQFRSCKLRPAQSARRWPHAKIWTGTAHV